MVEAGERPGCNKVLRLRLEGHKVLGKMLNNR